MKSRLPSGSLPARHTRTGPRGTANVAALLGFLALPAGAQQTNVVEVTASPIIEANRLDAFSAATTRVTETQVRELGALDLPAALRMTPGVQISLYNTLGNYSGNEGGSVYVRGMGTSRPGSEIKTYVDGLPVYMGLWNHPLMDLLPLNGMQSIDIAKGPQPQTSGNNFSAVNLTTRRPGAEGLSGDANASIGSYGSRVAQATLLGRHDTTDAMLAAGTAQSDGYRPNGDAVLYNLLGKLDYRINDTWSIGASWLYVDNHVGDPGDIRFPVSANAVGPYQSNGVARNNSETGMLALRLAHRQADWSGEVQVYENQGRNDLDHDPVWGSFDSSSTLSGLRWREQYTPWRGGELVGGLDVDRMSGSMTGPNVGASVGTPFAFGIAGSAEVPTFKLTSPYLGMSQRVEVGGGWTLQPAAGLRHYTSNIYPSRTAPNAGLSLIHDSITVYANHAVGVLYPGAETYALTRALPMAFAVNNGWNTLVPEKDRHNEVGLRWDIARGTHLDASLFRDDVSDRYVWSGGAAGIFGPPPASGTWSNAFPSYRLSGSEISLRQELGSHWTLFGGITGLSASLPNVPFAPATALSAGLTGHVQAFTITVDAQHQSGMYSQTWDRGLSNFTPTAVDGFTVANVRLAWHLDALGRNGEVYANLNNLFKTAYQYNAGYPMAGRNLRLGVAASF